MLCRYCATKNTDTYKGGNKMEARRCTVPGDVAIKKGQLRFGLKESDRGVEAVILPRFSIRCSLSILEKVIAKVNETPREHIDGQCEILIKKAIGNMGTRCMIADGNLIALDQDAATMLWQMKLPILRERHFIPI